MPDYDAIASKVDQAFQDKGTSMTLTKTAAGTHNPATGLVTGATETEYTVYGLVQAKRPALSSGERYFNEVLVKTDDKIVLVSSLEVVPKSGDKLTVGGTVFKIVSVVPVEPGGTALMYRALVRK